MRIVSLVTVALVVASPAAAKDAAVMVLGTYHFSNAGLDKANVKADDVTTPKRQAELERLTDALAAWRPDKVLVEWQYPQPFTVPEYRAFKPEDLKTKTNEVIQIGFRLARKLGHAEVYGFDEQPGPGEPDYFPFGPVEAFATANGQKAELDAVFDYFPQEAEAQTKAQETQSIPELLLTINDPARNTAEHAKGYYDMLRFGDGEDQPGAVLNAMWYMRNAKMFAKIGLIAKPGERVLVLVGSGHKYWLEHFAGTTPGFVAVDPRPYLEKAR
jgi:hypothetical protein